MYEQKHIENITEKNHISVSRSDGIPTNFISIELHTT